MWYRVIAAEQALRQEERIREQTNNNKQFHKTYGGAYPQKKKTLSHAPLSWHAFSVVSLAFGLIALLFLNQSRADTIKFSGDIIHPATSAPLKIVIIESKKNLQGKILGAMSDLCEATCDVEILNPSIVEMTCSGARMSHLKTTVYLQWTSEGQVMARMGSVITGLDEVIVRTSFDGMSSTKVAVRGL
jgi:hypothetical protein